MAPAQGVARTPVDCDGQIITDIVIRAQGPSFGGIFERSPTLSRLVRVLHVTTSPDIIRRFVLLERGQPCSRARRTETERVLRAQPFLAEASVTAYRDGSSGVRVEIVTVDEVSTIVGVGVRGGSPYVDALSLGNGNVNGLGIYALGQWREGFFYRDTYAARLVDYQLFGRPHQLEVQGARRSLGADWSAELSHPFFSDIQRVAWRVSGGSSHEFFGIVRPGASKAALSVRRSFADIGAILRIGETGRLSLFGASFSREMAAPERVPVVITDSGLVEDTSSALIGRYRRHSTARVNALWGVRNIEFVRVEGFDALSGEQDVRTGFQLGTLFGRSLSVIGSRDDDIFVALDAYAGIGSPRSFAGLQVQGEGRQSYDDNRWDDILGSGRAAWYFKPQSRHTVITSLEWSGGWRQRTPYQLVLGELLGGVRGYRKATLAGGRRGVARIEERWHFGDFRGNADIGAALFADAGRLWAGDVPFGAGTPVHYSVGLSFLAAIPPRSQRLWRMDIAFPAHRSTGAGVEIRLTNADRTRSFWAEPGDLRRSRERSVPSSIFTWP